MQARTVGISSRRGSGWRPWRQTPIGCAWKACPERCPGRTNIESESLGARGFGARPIGRHPGSNFP